MIQSHNDSMTQFSVVRVSRKGADRVASGHLWVFASDVVDRGEAQPGDAVTVVDARGRSAWPITVLLRRSAFGC